jgi:hypothetical protein
MKQDNENMADTAQKVQQNVRNMPLASIALFGLLGASAMALIASFKSSRKPFST